MRLRRLSLLALPVMIFAAACAPADETANDTNQSPTAAESQTAADCAAGKTMMEGMLHIGTDSPAYPPWFEDDDPTNGKGYESAVAYEVAKRLGFEEVMWVTVPFNQSYKPGTKEFDFDINQISITPERAKVVDFSDGYYQAAQAVITLKKSAAGGVASMADLADLKLGAQTGTTSLTAIRDVIQPATEPLVFEDTNAAKQALLNGQVDAILADLPTAFYITAVEIPKAAIVGQFQADTGTVEEFGMLFEKGNPLRDCVNLALAEMTDDGTLAGIEKEWLSDAVSVPELTP